jgi:hypothetical protein
VSYFRNNPDAVLDTRPPEEKLQTLESRLTDFDLETTEKFTILIHQKSLNYIIYGEDSPEAMRSHLSLGQFYNENHRPISALRHLQRVVELREVNSLEPPEQICLAVELAGAHLAMRNENRIEAHKQVGRASEALRNYMDEPIDDPALRYRRDLAKARILAARGEYAAAHEQYLITVDSLDEANGGEPSNVTAKLYAEIAENADMGKLGNIAKGFYRRAWQTFTDLGMEESATSIFPKVPKRPIESDDDA